MTELTTPVYSKTSKNFFSKNLNTELNFPECDPSPTATLTISNFRGTFFEKKFDTPLNISTSAFSIDHKKLINPKD